MYYLLKCEAFNVKTTCTTRAVIPFDDTSILFHFNRIDDSPNTNSPIVESRVVASCLLHPRSCENQENSLVFVL